MRYLISLILIVFIATPVYGQLTATVGEQLVGKSTRERADFKAQEIVKVASQETITTKDGYQIEIQNIEKIEGGLQVFVRAWKDGQPVGFGSDGTVEIERIRIYNPPILVPDGTYIYDDPVFGISYPRTVWKEDPQEALRIEIADTVRRIGKSGQRIESGKIGRTTSTFRSVAGAVHPVDGFVTSNTNATWSTVRDASAGVPTNNSDTQGSPYSRKTSGGLFQIQRTFHVFDTSAIPDTDVISAATSSLYAEAKNVDDNDGNDYLNVYQATLATSSSITEFDYDRCGATAGASNIDISSTITTSAFNDFPMNATGLSWVNSATNTELCFREGHDVANDPISANNQWNYVITSSADNGGAGTTQDPKLVVEHASAGGGSTDPQPTNGSVIINSGGRIEVYSGGTLYIP